MEGEIRTHGRSRVNGFQDRPDHSGHPTTTEWRTLRATWSNVRFDVPIDVRMTEPTFAAALRLAMAKRKTNPTIVARELGLGRSTLTGMLNGKMPRYDTAVRMAEHLHAPRLVEIAVAARTRLCPTCESPFMFAYEKPKTFCSINCRNVARQRKVRKHGAREGVIAKHRLTLYQDAVAKFCQACTLGTLCPDSRCSLRPVSPIPLAREKAA